MARKRSSAAGPAKGITGRISDLEQACEFVIDPEAEPVDLEALDRAVVDLLLSQEKKKPRLSLVAAPPAASPAAKRPRPRRRA